MLQVTRIVERHAQSQAVSLGAWLEFGQYFADVFALGRKHLGSFRIFGFIAKQMPVLFHV